MHNSIKKKLPTTNWRVPTQSKKTFCEQFLQTSVSS